MFGGIKSAAMASILSLITVLAFQNCGDAKQLTSFGNGDVYEGLDVPSDQNGSTPFSGNSESNSELHSIVNTYPPMSATEGKYQPEAACAADQLISSIEVKKTDSDVILDLSVFVEMQSYDIYLTKADELADQISIRIPSNTGSIKLLQISGINDLVRGKADTFNVAFYIDSELRSQQYIICP